jgi:hypothetical protein
MTRDMHRLLRGLGGRRATVRAEQLRAAGVSHRAIAYTLGVPTEAVSSWFEVQDVLALSDAGGAT